MTSLFPEQFDTEASGPQGPFVGVALEQSVDSVLTYAVPRKLVGNVAIGQRVRVPLGKGNRPAFGYVVSVSDTSDVPRIKPLLAVDDPRVLISGPLMELALWMSRYYCTPLGTVLESVIPSAVKKKIGLGYTPMVRLAKDHATIQTLLENTRAAKRRAVLARLLQVGVDEGIELPRLAGEAGVTPATVRKLQKLGLITITQQPDLPGLAMDAAPTTPAEKDILLNPEQQKVFDELGPRLAGGFSVNLLHGVTGSGKTEVYLQCIRRVIESGRRAIVLVPEIALTPQTVRRFTARFPRVAVLHSGLTASARHRYWQTILQGQADVVVGARSAIFAPLPDLGIIVVDEEHEASYKQDTAPRYHARDLAIKRAQLEKVPVLLGSATPSLESWKLVTVPPPGDAAKHPYHLLSLPNRVRGLQMPKVEVVDMRLANRDRPGVHLISQRLENALKNTFAGGHQAILLLNRRGYANFVYCPSCSNVINCKFCDATMTYHRSAGENVGSAKAEKGVHTGQLHCHYCLAVNPLPATCPVCKHKLVLFGLGTQRVEEELSRKFPGLGFARVDSDSMRTSRDYEQTLARFARGEIKLMLGTQMIAKGLDYPNVTLVGVINGDTALALPDFRAGERTFQLITQVAGRAGRGDAPGRVIVQTLLPQDPTIQAALRQDYLAFARTEMDHRRQVGLPPFARMARIILRDQNLKKLQEHEQKLTDALGSARAQVPSGTVAMKGPMPCAINRIAGYCRSQVVLSSPRPGELQRVLGALREGKFLRQADRLAVDVDPVSLL